MRGLGIICLCSSRCSVPQPKRNQLLSCRQSSKKKSTASRSYPRVLGKTHSHTYFDGFLLHSLRTSLCHSLCLLYSSSTFTLDAFLLILLYVMLSFSRAVSLVVFPKFSAPIPLFSTAIYTIKSLQHHLKFTYHFLVNDKGQSRPDSSPAVKLGCLARKEYFLSGNSLIGGLQPEAAKIRVFLLSCL